MKDLRATSYNKIMLGALNESDHEALFQVFVDSREDLSAVVAGWDEFNKDTFLRIQFQAQQKQYHNSFPDARFEVIVTEDNIIGHIYVASINDELRLVDVNLLPLFRNRGIGSALLRDLLDEGEYSNKRVTLHVQENNQAAHLYRNLGFLQLGENGIYQYMEWLPSKRR